MSKAEDFEPKMLHRFLYVCALTAARRGELLKLKWSDVDFGLNTLTFRVTKNKAIKELPMFPELSSFLKDLSRKSEFVFTNPEGKPLSEHTLRDYIDRFKGKHCFEKNWNTKSFRHAFAHLAKLAGWNPHAIQTYMGHETLEMTMGTYGIMKASEIKYDNPIRLQN